MYLHDMRCVDAFAWLSLFGNIFTLLRTAKLPGRSIIFNPYFPFTPQIFWMLIRGTNNTLKP